MHSTVYITHTGLLEPLGQSQILPYLRGLSRDYSITLITFEKNDDWLENARMQQAKEECNCYGIRWLPQRFNLRSGFLASAKRMLYTVWFLWREVRIREVKLIHARSYIPAGAALIVKILTGTPFVFDMRALWPEELIIAGRLQRKSLIYRALDALEYYCLVHAAAVVSLTNAAKTYLKLKYPAELERQMIAIIPTCADLDRFTPSLYRRSGPIVHGCIGTILSGWFRSDWLELWLSVASQKDTSARFEIVTRDDKDRIRIALDPMKNLGDRLTIVSSLPQEMPDRLRGHDLATMFFSDGLGKLGSSPTRMAEALGCGLPIITNEGVGDVGDIIRQYDVGVIVRNGSKAEMINAFDALEALRSDPSLSKRCRKAAEEVFSLKGGTEAYRKLYAQILARSGDSATHLPKSLNDK